MYNRDEELVYAESYVKSRTLGFSYSFSIKAQNICRHFIDTVHLPESRSIIKLNH